MAQIPCVILYNQQALTNFEDIFVVSGKMIDHEDFVDTARKATATKKLWDKAVLAQLFW